MNLFIAIIAVVALAIAGVAVFFKRKIDVKIKKGDASSRVKALALLANDHDADALNELILVVQSSPADNELYCVIAALLRRRGNIANAVQVIEGLIITRELQNNVLSAALQELIMDYKLSERTELFNANLSEKLPIILDKLAVSPLPEKLYIEALSMALAGKYDDAAKKFKQYEKAAGKACVAELATLYNNRAQTAKDTSTAIKHIKTASNINPLNIKNYMRLADLHISEGKEKNAIDEVKRIISGDIIRTRGDVEWIQNFFYQHSTIDELLHAMQSKINAGSANPAPYLFVSKYYTKRGDNEQAAEILRQFIKNIGAKVVISKAYGRALNDSILIKAFSQNEEYVCTHCGKKYIEYAEICSNCAESFTIDYL